jgi:hypothetical protein
MNRPVYFGLADRQLEQLWGKDSIAFQRTLLWNLLFQQGLVIPDVFLFISHCVEDEVLNNHVNSHFVSALDEGRLVVAARSNFKSFAQLRNHIKETGITGFRPDSEELAKILDNKGIIPKTIPWASNTGGQYASLLKQVLQQSEPSDPAPSGNLYNFASTAMSNFWIQSKEWRTQFLKEAEERTQMIDPIGGIRRTEIMKVFADHYHIDVNQAIDFRQIIASGKIPQNELESLRHYARIVTECYHLNQSIAFGARPGITNASDLTQIALSNHEQKAYVNSGGFVSTTGTSAIKLTAELPDYSMLYHLPPQVVSDLRNGYGAEYLSACDSWFAAQSAQNLLHLELKFKKYCAAISKAAKNAYIRESNVIECTLGAVDSSSQSVKNLVGILLGSVELVATGWNLPYITLSVLGGSIVYSQIRWLHLTKPTSITIPNFGIARADLVL